MTMQCISNTCLHHVSHEAVVDFCCSDVQTDIVLTVKYLLHLTLV